MSRARGRLARGVEPRGDVLVFLPGEREIRECADVLEGRRYPDTEVLPLFARLGLGDQQRVFSPGNKRRLILATNVAETSLTIPRIACVIDRGGPREPLEPGARRAAPANRAGQPGQRAPAQGPLRPRARRRLPAAYDEETELDRTPEFTDPEIRRSSLAGVILRMKSLACRRSRSFRFSIRPRPRRSPKATARCARSARWTATRQLTDYGRRMARLPVDPRLGRMLIEARKEHCLAEMLPIIAALESNDPRERPAEKTREADAAHARWKDAESDFIGILRLWRDVIEVPRRAGGGNATRCGNSAAGVSQRAAGDGVGECGGRAWPIC
jgi:ATP-dependent helicase HrpA